MGGEPVGPAPKALAQGKTEGCGSSCQVVRSLATPIRERRLRPRSRRAPGRRPGSCFSFAAVAHCPHPTAIWRRVKISAAWIKLAAWVVSSTTEEMVWTVSNWISSRDRRACAAPRCARSSCILQQVYRLDPHRACWRDRVAGLVVDDEYERGANGLCTATVAPSGRSKTSTVRSESRSGPDKEATAFLR